MKTALPLMARSLRAKQFVKYCLVGGSGVIADMAVLHFLAVRSGWNLSMSKFCSAETALVNNFIWNELWTFHGFGKRNLKSRAARFIKFHGICGLGILIAVALLRLFYDGLGLNLYLGNLLAIGLAMLWNFSMNALFNWSRKQESVHDFEP